MKALSFFAASSFVLASMYAGCATVPGNGFCEDVPGACGAADGSVTDSGGDGGVRPDSGPCGADKTPFETNCTPTEGTFVKPGATGGDGTIGKPLGSLATALAKGGNIYVCAGTLSEKIALSSAQVAAKVYGGLDCATWRFADGAATKVVVANGPALAVTDAAEALLFSDVTFEAQAGDGSPAGQSRIAAIASNAKALSFVRSTFVAEPGERGANGADGTPNGWAAGETGKGNAGSDVAPYVGAQKTCICTDGTSSTGGEGGPLNSAANPGFSSPTEFDDLPKYQGAGGYRAASTCSDRDYSTGKNGKAGAPGAAATTLGALSATGWVSTDGTSASASNPGGGGGGGGGGTAFEGGGGGGGCGGCGGGFGAGGTGGGASIGFASIGTKVRFTTCTFVVGAGGVGGKGGKGLAGNPGGGAGGSSACSGHNGGNGAGGSGGAGGTGGISAGIAYTGATPIVDPTTKYTKPTSAAKGGAGGAAGDKATTDAHVGNPGLAGAAGKDGEVADVFDAN
jgi:hypothetical protein